MTSLGSTNSSKPNPLGSDSRVGQVVTASGVGIYEFEVGSRNFYLSDSAFELLGSPGGKPPQTIEQWWANMNADDRARSVAHAREAMKDPTIETYEVSNRFYHADGHEMTLLTRARIFRNENGVPQRIFGVYIDITERLKLEEAIAQAQLQYEAERLASTEKDRVMAAISHEVRTPLNSILGFAKLIKEELHSRLDVLGDKLPANLYDDVEQMLESAEHLDHLLADFLDYSQLNAKSLKLLTGPFHLAEIISGMSQRLLRTCSGKGLGVEMETRINGQHASLDNWIFEGDQARIVQIVENLLSNASKFSYDGKIRFAVDVNTDEAFSNAQLQFTIEDQGVGMDQVALERAFLPFEQVHRKMNGQLSGTGLGLAIVKALSDAMDGELKMHSAPGEGTRVNWFVSLPVIARPSLRRKPKPDEVKKAKSPLHLLLADDVGLNLKILKRFIEGPGHTADLAVDGKEALELARSKKFDAILLDIEMPHLDGKDVVRQLRAEAGPNQNTPCFALSGQAFEKDIETAKEAGFDGYFPKPIQFDQLLDRLAEVGQTIDHHA